MATAMTLFQQPTMELPAHLANAFGESDNIVPRETTPALTFRGKTWRLRQGGDEIVLTKQTEDGQEPVSTVQVVVLNLNQKRSRTMYAGAFVEGQNQSPVCWSSDGTTPDADVKAPFAKTCAACPNSVKGSKITANNKETTACQTVKRLAVVPVSALDMEPLLLKVPQTSMWDKNNAEAEAKGYYAWDQYVDFLRARGVKHTASVVTKIRFDPNVAYPKLLFTAARWLTDVEVAAVVGQVNSDATKKLLVGKITEHVEAEAPEATPTPAAQAAPAPAQAAPAAGFEDDDEDAPTPPVKPAAAAKPKPTVAKPKPAVAAPTPPAPPAPVGGDDLAALAAAWDD